MFLPKKEKNLYTIGKILRGNKKLRKADPKAKAIQMSKQLKQYVDELQKNGLTFKNLTLGEFQTKNGLKYPGLIATQTIPSNSIMVRVPVDCLLTTRVAFLSEIQKVFYQNPKYFAKRFTADWEDHILLAYLLYEYQKAQKSQWYNLIKNLPREIDYAIFWQNYEIKNLQDNYMEIGVTKEKKKFQKQCKQFQTIAKKYPQIFKKDTVTADNIKWIHTHLVTRCFGKYFQYTTMVPFAQLFNHQCTDVYYTMYYLPGNPNDTKQQFYDELMLTQQQIAVVDTTDGTYDAEDYFDSNQQIEYKPFKQPSKNISSSEDILKDIRNIKNYLINFISFNDSVSFRFLLLTFQQLQSIYKLESIASQRNIIQFIHSYNNKYLSAVKQFYTKLSKNTYSYSIKQKKKPLSVQQQEDVQPDQIYFNKDWPKDKFDQFLMLCSTKDQFEKGSQVYFCYGRLPNKLLLMRYGIALQHNKYDHLFLRINIQQQVMKSKTMYEAMQEVGMNKYRRFKLKRTKINVEFITYVRSLLWNYREDFNLIFKVVDYQREKQVLNIAENILKSQLQKYKHSLETNQKLLENKALGYHDYFAIVYKVEQQRILIEHINMINYAKLVLQEVIEGKTIQQVLSKQKQPINLTRQIMMEPYFKTY